MRIITILSFITLFLYLTSPVFAATITVTSTLDNNVGCTLRNAVRSANSNTSVGGCTAGAGTSDLILLPSGTITLTQAGQNENAAVTGDLDIFTSIEFRGQGRDLTIIDGNSLDRVFQSGGSGISLIFRDLTVRNGAVTASSGSGGLELSSGGTILIERVLIDNCRGPVGAGLHFFANPGTLVATIRDTEIRNNVATNFGGGISCHNDCTFERVYLHHNSAPGNGTGGGIGIPNGTSTFVDSTIEFNTAGNVGGNMSVQGFNGVGVGHGILQNTTLRSGVAGGIGDNAYVNGGQGGTNVSTTYCGPSSCTLTLQGATIIDGDVYINATGTYPGQLISLDPPPAPVCGDGNVDSGEECDDGNVASGDGCSSTCQAETCMMVCQ